MSAPSAIARPAKIPRGILHGREVACIECPTPCARQTDPAHYGEPCASCPLPIPRWGPFGNCEAQPTPTLPPAPMRGLGDLVAKIADPIAKTIGINKSKCGCRSRQEWLNRAVPFAPPDSAP
jgi:hypothetical protein